jgi:hypothetical protein
MQLPPLPIRQGHVESLLSLSFPARQKGAASRELFFRLISFVNVQGLPFCFSGPEIDIYLEDLLKTINLVKIVIHL